MLSRRGLLLGGLTAWGAARAASHAERSFHHDHVLGTSLDVWLRGGDAAAEDTVLNEIERQRRVFSVHDADSELSRLNRADGPFAASDDLRTVLAAYDAWVGPAGGAVSGQTGELIRLWQQATRAGHVDEAALADAARRIASPGWTIDGETVTRRPGRELNLNSAAKGHILHKAALAASAHGRDVLLSLGGDLFAVGEWSVGVQDPFRHADNDRPLTTLRLCDGAVATSGGYQRHYRVGGVNRSHLIDPRTGRTADHVAGATVVAPHGMLANLLATALCVLTPEEGLALVARVPGVECLIVTAADRAVRSAGFAALEEPKKDAPADKPSAWPAGYQVTFDLEIPKPTTGKKARRPYVAIWVEDGDGKPVRSVTVWGNSSRWLPTMSGWWKLAKDEAALIKATTRATRAPGKHSVVWDGKDDKGTPLPRGTYTIKVEVHREHGKHVFQTGKLPCLAAEATLTLEKNAETEATVVTYGPRK